jgi:hypothetical protein
MKMAWRIVSVAGLVGLASSSAVAQGFTENFDNITTLTGWDPINVSEPIGLIGYFQGNTAVFGPQASAGYLGVNYNSAANGPGGDGTDNNWMLLPLRTLNNGDTLKFWTRTVTASIYPDRLEVRRNSNGASTNVGLPTVSGSDVGDFTTLLLSINPNLQGPPSATTFPDVWTQYTVTLSGLPAGGLPARLAFRYFVTNGGPGGVNSNYIGIDEVEYTANGGGGGQNCYANCDNSTNAPCLNVNDFVCFNNAFSAGLPYANCDASTNPPILNVNDFVCFNNAYSASCTNPCLPRP